MARIKLIAWDSWGRFTFLIGDKVYDDQADGAAVYRAQEMARRRPGKALNYLKQFCTLIRREVHV